MEELKSYLASKDISAKDVGKAIIVHEILGVAVMFGAWGACLAIKPSKHVINRLQLTKLKQWKQTQEKMNKSSLVKMIKESKYISPTTATSLAVSFGESYFLRKLMMPILVPFKIWLTYEIIIRTKSRE